MGSGHDSGRDVDRRMPSPGAERAQPGARAGPDGGGARGRSAAAAGAAGGAGQAAHLLPAQPGPVQAPAGPAAHHQQTLPQHGEIGVRRDGREIELESYYVSGCGQLGDSGMNCLVFLDVKYRILR